MECHRGTPGVRRGADRRPVSRISPEECKPSQLGSAAGKQIIVQRGRWCHTDIDEIYSRASLGEHVAASVALSAPGGARSLEQVVPGWVQPARFRR